jgi:high-affinity Fe2+/Pb2+ permease
MLRAPRSSTRDTEMSLRAFHLLFIAMSVVLAAFCAAWAVGQYRAGHQAMFMVTAVGALIVAGGLAVYGTAFQRRTKNL